MFIKKILAGTCIYLTKKNKQKLYIQPEKTIVNDNLYVAYDVRVDGVTVIPKGTRVVGDWVTESTPVIAAQLQINWIYLSGSGQEIQGDSEMICSLTDYDSREIGCIPFMSKNRQYHSPSNITRRMTTIGLHSKTLLDNRRDMIYLEIDTTEIPIILTKDFLAFQSFTGRQIQNDMSAVQNHFDDCPINRQIIIEE